MWERWIGISRLEEEEGEEEEEEVGIINQIETRRGQGYILK